MTLIPSVETDLPEICEWIASDPWHQQLGGDFWLTGSRCLFACKLLDEEGTVCYLRVEEEDDSYRLHTQFAPEHLVSKRRVVRAAIEFFRVLGELARANGKQNILTESISPKLIAFLGRLGFLPAGSNDYKLEV